MNFSEIIKKYFGYIYIYYHIFKKNTIFFEIKKELNAPIPWLKYILDWLNYPF